MFGKTQESAAGALSDAAHCTLRAVELLGNFLRGEPHQDSFHDRPIVNCCGVQQLLDEFGEAGRFNRTWPAVNESTCRLPFPGEGHLTPDVPSGSPQKPAPASRIYAQ